MGEMDPPPIRKTSILGIIQTPRLTLRPFQADDLASLCALRSQPQVMIYSPIGRPQTSDETRQFLEAKLAQQEKEDNGGRFEFAICERERETDGELLGVCGIQYGGVGLGTGRPSLGYQLRSEYWGRGYATEAVRALLSAWWALSERPAISAISTHQKENNGERGRECVAAVTVEDNGPSRRVLEKCGFALEKVWEESDLRDSSKMVRLCCYVAQAPQPQL